MNQPERDHRRWFLAAMLLVMLHGAFYAAFIPPWDLFDEEQHLDYALTLRDERRIPELDDTISQSLIDSAIETDRWTTFRIGRPDGFVAGDMGLEGRSFEGYQPPLYYVLVAPVTLAAGDDPLAAMYLARSLGVLILAGFAATAWALARRWFAGDSASVPFCAALVAGGVPAAAEAAGRINNDLLAATLISLGLLATINMIDHPIPRNALITGIIATAAILTKSPGVLSLGVALLGLLIVWRRGRLSGDLVGYVLLPGVVALLAWTWFIYSRYAVLTGSGAFLELVVPFPRLSVGEFLWKVWLNAWSSYWGAYGGGWLRIATGVAGLTVTAAGGYGLVTRDRRTAPSRNEAFVLTGALALGLLAVLWAGNASGLVHPHGRMMLPVYPALAALVVGGWSRLHRYGAFIPAALTWLAALIFAGYWFLPFFYGSST